ncbi:MAG: cell division protein ZapB [Treponema sp.]|nr:cell division protein ZapB [Treponema sp.]
MITLDQVLLLQKKVESAVAKIAQLKAENDALRSKCAELTNALSAKTEQFSTFEADQSRIEHGILQALERLNAVENEVLGNAGVEASSAMPAVSTEMPQEEFEEPAAPETAPATTVSEEPVAAPAESYEAPVVTSFEEPVHSEQTDTSFSAETSSEATPQTEEPSPDDPQQGQFDIF